MNGCPPFWGPQGLCTREAYSSWTFISQRIIHLSHQRYTACTSYLISKLHQSNKVNRRRDVFDDSALYLDNCSLLPQVSQVQEVYILLICQGFSSDLELKGCQFPWKSTVVLGLKSGEKALSEQTFTYNCMNNTQTRLKFNNLFSRQSCPSAFPFPAFMLIFRVSFLFFWVNYWSRKCAQI